MHFYTLVIVLLAFLTLVRVPFGQCGPARSIALVAQRSPKIPISIRAPFKHTETMVARGYGKRSFLSGSNAKQIFNEIPLTADGMRDKDGIRQYLLPRGFGKRLSLSHPVSNEYEAFGKKEMNFLDNDVDNSNGDGGIEEQISNEAGQIDSVPIEWAANELSTNLSLLKTILYRFVDANRDGYLTPQEFLGTPNNDVSNK